MTNQMPTFPPLLNGIGIAADEYPSDWVVSRLVKQQHSAGDFIWSETSDKMRFALVLEPEVKRPRCAEMIYVAMLAFGDAAGAIIPPEIAITYQWPNVIQMNEGNIGFAELIVSDEHENDVPDWMVLSVEISLTPSFIDQNPGENYDYTTLWDEGCADITGIELLESTSRHLVNVIHTWSEDGFKPIHEQWCGRLNKTNAIAPSLNGKDKTFVGIDEVGNGLLRIDGKTRSIAVLAALDNLRDSSVHTK